MVRVGSIVIRVDDLQKQAEFWSNTLHYRRHIDRPDFVVLSPTEGEGPNISLDTMHSEMHLPRGFTLISTPTINPARCND